MDYGIVWMLSLSFTTWYSSLPPSTSLNDCPRSHDTRYSWNGLAAYCVTSGLTLCGALFPQNVLKFIHF